MQKEECYLVGNIVKTHNLKGEVMLSFDVDNPAEYAEIDTFFLDIKGKLVPYFVKKLQLVANNNAIIQFEDVNHIDLAKKLVKIDAYLPLDILGEQEDGGFYLHEVIGYTVIDAQKGTLGTISNIYEGDLQDLFGMQYQGAEVLIPVVDNFILEIIHEQKIIHTQLPNGLVELYLEDDKNAKIDDMDDIAELEP